MVRLPSSVVCKLSATCIGLTMAASSQAQAPTKGSPRWRLQHRRELQATLPLLRNTSPLTMPDGAQAKLDDVSFERSAGAAIDYETYRKALSLDGFIVLKDGKVVFERYYDAFGPRGTHNWASMSKSIVGVLALRLAKSGEVDLKAPLARYVRSWPTRLSAPGLPL